MRETCCEFVKRIWGTCTLEQMDGLLWHCTAFPCISVSELEAQLKEVKKQSGGDYNKAMATAEKEIDQALKDKDDE